MALSQRAAKCVDDAIKFELKLGHGQTTKHDVLMRTRLNARESGVEAEVRLLVENSVMEAWEKR